MKKLLSLLLCGVIVIGLCGCEFADTSKDLLSKLVNFDNTQVVKLEGKKIEEGVSPLCYDKLSENQKRIYEILYTAAEELTEGWIDVGNTKDSTDYDVLIAFNALTDDRPEFFWLPLSYFISEKSEFLSSRTIVAFQHKSGDKECSYLFPVDEIPQMKEELKEKVAVLTENANRLKTPFEKEVYLHDALLENLVYNDNGSDVIYTSYSALVKGEAVCEGYAKALQLLFNEVQIPNAVIHGVAEGELHIWNLVNIGNNWYHLDSTWNDREDFISKEYFNVTDEVILKNHTVSDFYTGENSDNINQDTSFNFISVKCNSLDFNFYNFYGRYLEPDLEKAVSAIKNAASLGEKGIELLITDEEFLKDFSDNYQTYCRRLQNKLYRKNVSDVELSTISIKENTVYLSWK